MPDTSTTTTPTSVSTTTVPVPRSTQLIQVCGAIAISILIILAFILGYYEAYISNNQHAIDTLGNLVNNAVMIVVGYWLGSSMGSQKKDDMLLSTMPPVVTTTNAHVDDSEIPPPPSPKAT